MAPSDLLIDRTAPPAAGAERPFRFPEFERHHLSSGLELIVCRQPRFPLAGLDLYAPGGADRDPEDRPGLASMTAALLDEGSKGLDGEEIARLMEGLGGHLATGAGWNAAYASVSVLSRDLGLGCDLLRAVAAEPVFPEEEVERVRAERLADLLQNKNDARSLADLYLTRAIYSPALYGRPKGGDEESVGAMTRQEIQDFYDRCYSAAGSQLIAVGDLDSTDLLQRLEPWRDALPAPAPVREPQDPPYREHPQVVVVDRPGAAQTELRLGHAGVPRTDPRFPSLSLLNTLLGGKFTSRINLNLRERHGFTYGAHSRFTARRYRGPFFVSTAVGTEVTGAAAREILKEIERIREELVPEDELRDSQTYVRGVFVHSLQTVEDLGQRLATVALYGLPDDYWDRYQEQVARTTAEDLRRLARETLHPEQMVIVAAGPAKELLPQLEGLGEIAVWDPETDQRVPVSAP